MRDAINKAARFIINQCLNDQVGNLIIGWNEGHKNGSGMGKRNNQNFVIIPTGRLIERLKQLCPEYGILLNIARKVATQLGLNLAEVGRGALTLPRRVDLFSDLTKSYRKQALLRVSLDHVATTV